MPKLQPLDQVRRWRIVQASPAGEPFPLTREHTICGRDPHSDLVLPHPAVSRRQFEIHCRHGGCYLEDRYSRCGTFLERPPGGRRNRIEADCEIEPGHYEAIGLTPLREGDVFGHPACPLTLERITPMTRSEWAGSLHSQSLLLALRDTPVAAPCRLHRFLEACMAEFHEADKEGLATRLRNHPDAWSAAAGTARAVVARATSAVCAKIGREEPTRQQLDQEIWRVCENAETTICRLLRELIGDPYAAA